MSYLTDYKEIDGGYVDFGGNLKRGKITRKVPLKLSSHDDGSKPSSDNGKKVNEVNTVDDDLRKESECTDHEKEDNVSSTNIIIDLPFDPKMPALEDDSIFDFSSNDEDDGVVADMNNLDTTI
nr:hypothetical protein [Tanacetum cinerariifolium]